MIVRNLDVNSEPYEEIRYTPRPSHADYPAFIKYGGYNDYRGGGRFSGRLTVAFIMAGSIAKQLLKILNIEILAHTIQIGNIKVPNEVPIENIRKNVYRDSVRCALPNLSKLMRKELEIAGQEGNSLGGIVETVAIGVPVGFGEPIFDRLDADISKMMFNIPAVKGVEFGAGFNVASLKGSENNDNYLIKNGKIITATNNAGGIVGGISNGMPIIVRIAFKPPSSININQKTINLKTMKETKIKVFGRHDPCVVPRAVVVVESCLSLVLVDHAIRGGFINKIIKD
jgi:chorismate synthase